MGVLVGRSAPDFKATAVVKGQFVDNFTLSNFTGKHIILFFYPMDFTFVCPTELHAFNERLPDFNKLGVELIAVSVDSHFSHFAWLNTKRSEGGIEGVSYPIVSDINKTISRDYDVLVDGQGIAYRGLFLIDTAFVVRHQVVNDLPFGRSVDEAVRMVEALQFNEKYGEVCPANWHTGDKSMKPTTEGLKKYFK
jgi:peroxiredoxin (alkyl hydroperoxide reductase subunit C)